MKRNRSARDPVVREESPSAGGRSLRLLFDWNGEPVPAVLLIPHGSDRACPAALLLHGFNSKKEHMASSVGEELLARGIASLALDLPLHGERSQGPFTPPGNPFNLMGQWRAAQQECRLAFRFLEEHREMNRGKLSVIGYSLGAYLGLKAASEEAHLGAVVLAAAGDIPDYVPFSGMVRRIADPLQWVRDLKSRPLLMMHGRQDTIVSPDLAMRLFDAAGEPKQILWFDSGHILPQEAMKLAADWLENTLAIDD